MCTRNVGAYKMSTRKINTTSLLSSSRVCIQVYNAKYFNRITLCDWYSIEHRSLRPTYRVSLVANSVSARPFRGGGTRAPKDQQHSTRAYESNENTVHTDVYVHTTRFIIVRARYTHEFKGCFLVVQSACPTRCLSWIITRSRLYFTVGIPTYVSTTVSI